MTSQTGGKRVAAATVHDGLSHAFFSNAYEAKRLRSSVERNDLLPFPPVRCGTGGTIIGRRHGEPDRNPEGWSSHPPRIKIKIIP
jgi:hypothetical protein